MINRAVRADSLLTHLRFAVVVAVLVALVIGCSDTQPMHYTDAPDASAGSAAKPTDAASASDEPVQSASASSADMQELEQLWERRTAQTSSAEDYPIGPGDVLTVSVPDID